MSGIVSTLRLQQLCVYVMVDPQVLMRSAKHANTGCAMTAPPHDCALAQICGYANKYK